MHERGVNQAVMDGPIDACPVHFARKSLGHFRFAHVNAVESLRESIV